MPELLKVTDVIVPNETESATLTGIKVTDEDSMVANYRAFKKMGVATLIITVGDKGAFYANENGHEFLPAFKVKPVDTTLCRRYIYWCLEFTIEPDFSNITDAINFAQHASSLTVQRMGAMPSIPKLAEIQGCLLKSNKKIT